MDIKFARNVALSAATGILLVAFPQIGIAQNWVQSQPVGVVPVGRAYATFTGGQGDMAFLYGGLGGTPLAQRQDFWWYDAGTNEWTQISATSSPGRRHAHGASYQPGKFLVWGGSAGGSRTPYTRATWFYREATGSWVLSPTRCTNRTPCPARRWKSPLAYDSDRNQHVLFGGQDPWASPIIDRRDTWVYQINAGGTAGAWTRKFPVSAPSLRHAHVMAEVPTLGGVVLYGGVNAAATVEYKDMWLWNGTTWSVVTQNNVGPSTNGAAFNYGPSSDKLVLFGGTNLQSTVFYGNTWTFDFNTRLWTNDGSTTGLGNRDGAAMATTGNQTVGLSHGQLVPNTNTFADDTWERP